MFINLVNKVFKLTIPQFPQELLLLNFIINNFIFILETEKKNLLNLIYEKSILSV